MLKKILFKELFYMKTNSHHAERFCESYLCSSDGFDWSEFARALVNPMVALFAER